MAPNNQNKSTSQQRHKTTHWFLACLGIHPSSRTTSNNIKKKGNKHNSGGRRRFFKLCMPKIKVVFIRRKRDNVSFDYSKKGSQQSLFFDANKVKNHNKVKHAYSTIQEPKDCKDHYDHPNPSPNGQSDTTKSCKQGQNPTRDESNNNNNKVVKDSFIGVSIMVITLVIMSLWGRLCAILCMSVWLYCVSLLRACKDNVRPNLDNVKMDVASKLYRKRSRVTLEGLFRSDT